MSLIGSKSYFKDIRRFELKTKAQFEHIDVHYSNLPCPYRNPMSKSNSLTLVLSIIILDKRYPIILYFILEIWVVYCYLISLERIPHLYSNGLYFVMQHILAFKLRFCKDLVVPIRKVVLNQYLNHL